MTMSFFITSRGGPKGGDFRVNAADMDGLAGADALCKELATAVSAELGMKTWHAYLSTSTVNARDRIGKGPWRNAKGVIIANSVEQLHNPDMLNATWPMGAGSLPLILDEKGAQVPTGGAEGQRHDIITGSNPMGMADGTNTCSNWTSTMGMAANGHFNRAGGARVPRPGTPPTPSAAVRPRRRRQLRRRHRHLRRWTRLDLLLRGGVISTAERRRAITRSWRTGTSDSRSGN
jgi:hypothetical protein